MTNEACNCMASSYIDQIDALLAERDRLAAELADSEKRLAMLRDAHMDQSDRWLDVSKTLADERDALKAELAKIRTEWQESQDTMDMDFKADMHALRQERDRLREALEAITKVYYGRDYFVEHVSIARKALTESGGEK
jgi:small-conductance mechanosensitive channel